MSLTLSRRGALVLPALVVAGAAACSRDPQPATPSAGPTATAPVSSDVATTSAPAQSVVLDTTVDAVPARLEVGPLVRVGSRSVLRVQVMTDGERVSVATALEGWLKEAYTMQGVLVMSLTEPEARVWGETDMSNLITLPWTEDEGVLLTPTFGEVPPGLGTVTVLLPNLGLVTDVPVVDEGESPFDAAAAVEAASIDDELAGPFVLSTFTAAADGSSDTSVDSDSVTVTVAGDVAFATDSAELSAEADTVLASVTEQLGLYPSGGTLVVTGHTDDVADDAYNLELSQRRAQAVADRIGVLTDLGRWSVTVVGKGESEPRAEGTSDDARAANRRVEVLAEPSDPSEAERTRQALQVQGPEPQAAGVVGTGAQGVEVEDPGPHALTLHLALPRVRRVGAWLVGNVELTPRGGQLSTSIERFRLPTSLSAQWGGRLAVDAGTASFTLLQGGTRVMAAQYETPRGYVPAMTLKVDGAPESGTVLLGMVWPDTGQDTVTLDLPGNGRDGNSVVARLTDVPVED